MFIIFNVIEFLSIIFNFYFSDILFVESYFFPIEYFSSGKSLEDKLAEQTKEVAEKLI